MNRFDLVVFGATGFTGKYVVQEILNVVKNNNLTWAIAGRNKKKLEELLASLSGTNNVNLKNTPLIIADATDSLSLNVMAAQSSVVLNCCGPFRFFGEAVVKACVENGASHVDISGEPQYMESMQLKYHNTAKKNNVYIVSACGIDSIPTDLGVVYLEKEFDGQVNSVETYLEIELMEDKVKQSSALLHYTTWESAIFGYAFAHELSALRKQLYPNRLPPLKPRIPARSAIHKSDVLNKWCIPFPGSDKAVVQRTQRFLLEFDNKRPVQVNCYIAFKSFLQVLQVTTIGFIFGFLALFSFGRRVLLQHPKLFTLGVISHEGPSEEVAAATKFTVTIIGRGWRKKQAEPFDNPQSPPDKVMAVRVSGFNPGYGATASTLVASALTILRESHLMPETGGVLPPGVAFAKTSFIRTLTTAGYEFEVVKGRETVDKPWHSYLGGFIQDLISKGIY